MSENNPFQIVMELRKRQENTLITITEEMLKKEQDKILTALRKECVDLQTWFAIILYFYSKQDYSSFKKFSDELTKAGIEQNPYYKDQKQTFIYILNILSFFYSSIAEKTKDKEIYEEFSTLSTSLVNQAEKITSSDPMTLVCKGFLFFTQGDYENSDLIFTSVSDYSGNLPRNIVILAKLGLALNAYNQLNYQKAISYFVTLMKDYDYLNENILESLGICYYFSNQTKKAKEIFEVGLEHYPNNYKIKTYLSIIELKDIDNEDFDENLQKIITSYESNEFSDCSIPALLMSLSNILLISGKYTEAEMLCRKLNSQLEFGEIKYNTNNDNAINTYNNIDKNEKLRRDYSEIKSGIYSMNAKYLLCLGKKDEAFSYFLRSVQANPRNIEAQFGLGQIYLYTQNLIDAEKCFTICKSILDENKKVSFKVLKYLAYILSKTKRKEVDKTIAMYKTAIATKNDDIDCYVELAELLNLKSPQESLSYYKEAVRLIKLKKENHISDKDNSTLYSYNILPEILNNIGCILLRLDRTDEVESYLTQAKNIVKSELAGKHSEETKIRLQGLKLGIDFNFVLYYEKKAMFDYTHFYCKKIISENPYFVEAYIKLSELARMRGNKTKANEYIKLAIEKSFIEEKNKQKKEQEEKSTNDKKEEKQKAKRLLSLMNKPINPLIINAFLQYEQGNEQEAMQTLNQILKQFDDRDPYTLIFLGNIYYSLAIESRVKKPNVEKLNKAVELYFHALELDKYNSMAAVGLCNCLAEYNYVDKALEIYKSITETMEDNHSAFVNESLLYMNEKKYEKASIILNKVLKKLFNGKHQTIENLLAKCYIETKEFAKANKLLKNLMMRYPDNIGYKYNYGILLIAKSDEILSKTERKVSETKESIMLIEKCIKLFEKISGIKREDKEEMILKTREFIYKCNEMVNLCKVNLSTANDRLKQDIEREKEMNQKIQLSMLEYTKIIEANNANKDKDDENNAAKKALYEKNKEMAEALAKMTVEDPNKPIKKKKKEKESKKIKDDLIDDNELEDEGKNESESYLEKKRKRKHKHKHHKHHHHHHKHRSEDEEESDGLLSELDEGEKEENDGELNDEIKMKKKKKLRKKIKEEDEEDPFAIEENLSVKEDYDKEFEDENKKEEDSPKIENEEKNQEVNVVEKTE